MPTWMGLPRWAEYTAFPVALLKKANVLYDVSVRLRPQRFRVMKPKSAFRWAPATA